MSDFSLKTHQIQFPPQTPLGQAHSVPPDPRVGFWKRERNGERRRERGRDRGGVRGRGRGGRVRVGRERETEGVVRLQEGNLQQEAEGVTPLLGWVHEPQICKLNVIIWCASVVLAAGNTWSNSSLGDHRRPSPSTSQWILVWSSSGTWQSGCSVRAPVWRTDFHLQRFVHCAHQLFILYFNFKPHF